MLYCTGQNYEFSVLKCVKWKKDFKVKAHLWGGLIFGRLPEAVVENI